MKLRQAFLLLIAPLTGGLLWGQTTDRVQHGHDVFERWCAGCHNPNPALQRNGQGLVGSVFAGTYLLDQRYKGSKPAALEERTDLTPELVKYTVRHGLNMMPRSRKTEISDDDLDALSAYLIHKKS